jgi:hypothetical protein
MLLFIKRTNHAVSARMRRKTGKNLLTCESLDANMNRAASWVKLLKSMEVWHLPNDFCWIAIEKGMAHTTTHLGTRAR